jgi:hypothetical protein
MGTSSKFMVTSDGGGGGGWGQLIFVHIQYSKKATTVFPKLGMWNVCMTTSDTKIHNNNYFCAKNANQFTFVD